MSASAHSGDINFVKVGAVAAFLLAAALVAVIASFGALTDVDFPRTDTEEFLDDVVDKKNLLIATVWLFAFLSLLIVPYFLGLYYGLRRGRTDRSLYCRTSRASSSQPAVRTSVVSPDTPTPEPRG